MEARAREPYCLGDCSELQFGAVAELGAPGVLVEDRSTQAEDAEHSTPDRSDGFLSSYVRKCLV